MQQLHLPFFPTFPTSFTRHQTNPESSARKNCESSLQLISRQQLKAARERGCSLHVSNGTRRLLRCCTARLPPAFSSRHRKIRCDGAKPVCYHCSQREGDEPCSYDALPKRRGPDRFQGARTRGTKPKEENEPRRRRRRSMATGQAGNGSQGIRQPSITAEVSALDTSGDTSTFVHPQQSGDPSHTLGSNALELQESSMRTSVTASSNQMLALQSTSNRHLVSDFVSS
jgi:hypothetical protein